MTIVKRPDELKQKGFRLFFVYGVDVGRADDIIEETIGWFRSSEPKLDLRRFSEEDISRDFAAFEGAISSGSLFGSASIGVIRLHSENLANKLAAFVEEANTIDGALFINGDGISPKSKLVTVFEKSKSAVAIRLFEPNLSELITAAKAILQKENVRADDETIKSIIENTAKDTLSVRSQILNFCLFAGRGGHINQDTVSRLLVNNRDGVLDEAVNAIFEARVSKAIESVFFCLRDGESAIRIFNLLIIRAKLLFSLIANLEMGDSLSVLVKERRFGIFWKQQEAIAKQVNLWSRQSLDIVLRDLIDLDAKCKARGGSISNELLLERGVLRIAQLSGIRA